MREGSHHEARRPPSEGDPSEAVASGGIGARAFERALAGRGLLARVEGRGALAIVIPAPDAPAFDVATRRWVVQAAQESGFTHVALELPPDAPDADAALPGRHPA